LSLTLSICQAHVAERDLGHVAERRGRLDLVVVVERVGEAELDVDARGTGRWRDADAHFGGIVVAQVPVFVVDVHLDIERVADLVVAVTQPAWYLEIEHGDIRECRAGVER